MPARKRRSACAQHGSNLVSSLGDLLDEWMVCAGGMQPSGGNDQLSSFELAVDSIALEQGLLPASAYLAAPRIQRQLHAGQTSSRYRGRTTWSAGRLLQIPRKAQECCFQSWTPNSSNTLYVCMCCTVLHSSSSRSLNLELMSLAISVPCRSMHEQEHQVTWTHATAVCLSACTYHTIAYGMLLVAGWYHMFS